MDDEFRDGGQRVADVLVPEDAGFNNQHKPDKRNISENMQIAL